MRVLVLALWIAACAPSHDADDTAHAPSTSTSTPPTPTTSHTGTQTSSTSPSHPPTVSITEPTNGTTILSSAPLTVSVWASDPDDDATRLTLDWGDIEGPVSVDADGEASFSLFLGPGDHTLRVEVTDPAGSMSNDEVTLTVLADEDSDGFSVPLDCDDEDASVHPGAIEVCNDGQDDDCNGLSDDDDPDVYLRTGTLWHADMDGDGFGVEAGIVACAAPERHVSDNTDCNDDEPETFPGAWEQCNGFDDDCDGLDDAEDPDITDDDLLFWYLDGDGDGWGTFDSFILGCSPVPPYVPLPFDCDDTIPTIHPEAVEICNEIDEDCDGIASPCVGFDSVAHTEWNGGEPLALAGYQVDFGGDLTDDGAMNVVISSVLTEAIYIVDTTIGGGDLPGAALTILEGDPLDPLLAASVASIADHDGDGFDDLLVGSPVLDDGRGNAALLLGPLPAGTHTIRSLGISITSETTQGLAQHMGPAGDVNDDGNPDLWIAAPQDSQIASQSGAVFLFAGPLTAPGVTTDDALASIRGTQPLSFVGLSTVASDIDADGTQDLIVGIPYHDGFIEDTGRVALFFSPLTIGLETGRDEDWFLAGSGLEGAAVAAADLTGDGRREIVIGSPGLGDDALGKIETWWPTDPTPVGTITGVNPGDQIGDTLTTSADLNHDGLADLVYRTAGGAAPLAGAIRVFYGPILGDLRDDEADAWIDGDGSLEQCGKAFNRRRGDATGDGLDDLLVGCSDSDPVVMQEGSVWLLSGDIL